ncbi:hypothetical protein [Sorangium sp. So ce362]|uniref:hypothetical protein n=1 Tax=Sorangium sp. So ce362 TaxID=3133303 RepID=UPI003F64127A
MPSRRSARERTCKAIICLRAVKHHLHQVSPRIVLALNGARGKRYRCTALSGMRQLRIDIRRQKPVGVTRDIGTKSTLLLGLLVVVQRRGRMIGDVGDVGDVLLRLLSRLCFCFCSARHGPAGREG